ncbi:MAG: biotin/lipoyl-binding protein [Gammaproteobacteria bacterium]|nr:biotin/lipoyl-binding protein [Gammaproteobacteria bacterium]
MAHVAVRPISRILVANRGEIARRVFRTAHTMGISTVAVYADGDAQAPFVGEADIAISLGGATAAQSYLDSGKIMAACRSSGADAVHPGYGFLSENAEFAQAVIAAGLTWIGPPVAAIAGMGDKLAAKNAMLEAGVPTLPARELKAQDDLAEAAAEIGFPALVKAAAGGGGRGMRVVESPDALAAAVAGARREAAAACGNDSVFLERWLAAARHVEVQILGDCHGRLVHLFERECSIQRRHQKIIEEAPSPAVDDELRELLGAAALKAARQIGYASAGTVEFLLDGRDFWFLEVNTRLQVEHPVTEAITGLDLVREQIRVAQGEPLSCTQEQLAIDGHAIEARLYAEDPARRFLPSPGTIKRWRPAALGRFDSGVETGSEVSVYFDPMIAKVITHAPSRREAAAKLARALEQTQIYGVTHNRDFLVSTLRSAAFLAGDTSTDFIERQQPARTRAVPAAEVVRAAMAAALFAQVRRRAQAKVLRGIASGWRNSVMPPERVGFIHAGEEIRLEYRRGRDNCFRITANHAACRAVVIATGADWIDLQADDRRSRYVLLQDGVDWYVHGPEGAVELRELPRFPPAGGAGFAGGLFAPMPAKVLATHVAQGDRVNAGQLLVVLEAMKMEHRVTAPVDGTVTELRVAQGDQVDNGELLVALDEAAL